MSAFGFSIFFDFMRRLDFGLPPPLVAPKDAVFGRLVAPKLDIPELGIEYEGVPQP